MSSVRLVTAFSRLIPLILAPIACSLAVSNELDSKNPNNTRTDAGETADANEASPPKDAGNAWDSNPTIDAAADAPIDVVNEPEASVTAF